MSGPWCFTLDSPELAHLREADPVLGAVIERVAPIELNPGRDHFRSLAGMIAGQQLSVAAADTIWRRFVDLVGTVDARDGCLGRPGRDPEHRLVAVQG